MTAFLLSRQGPWAALDRHSLSCPHPLTRRALLPQKCLYHPSPKGVGNRMATTLCPGSLCSPEHQPPFLGQITKAAFELDNKMPLGPKMAAPGAEERPPHAENNGQRWDACAQARCGQRGRQGEGLALRGARPWALLHLRAAEQILKEGRRALRLTAMCCPSAQSPKPGAKWQRNPALTSKREAGICAVLVRQGLWFLLNGVSYGIRSPSLCTKGLGLEYNVLKLKKKKL